jgi:hypothetical protein
MTTDTPAKLEFVPDLDEDEREFRALRRDLPGAKGASEAGILTISVGKVPRRGSIETWPATAVVGRAVPGVAGRQREDEESGSPQRGDKT